LLALARGGCNVGSGGKLTAGRGDVAAPRQPHRYRNPSAAEDVLERGDRLGGGTVVHPGRVVRDQVHLEDFRIQQFRELACLLDPVVYSAQQYVLDE
jgi:hypothetical protein